MMRIFKWDRFNDIIENRIKKIDMNTFKSLLENCHNYDKNVLYKKIYNPDFETGIFNKSFKKHDFFNSDEPLIDNTYPQKNTSLVCTSEHVLDDDDTTLFVVLPYKESLFTIQKNDSFFKGYWKDKIQWIEKFNENKLWTESNCLLIKKDIWDYFTINENNKDYTDRDVLATTLIGETGGDVKDAPMVLNVLKNRAKKRNTKLYQEALRKWQFSMWNRHYKNGDSILSIINEYKKSNKWGKTQWDYVYSLIDKKNSLPDTTKGSTMYYAHNKTLPYWANNDSPKMLELGKEWKQLAKNNNHTYGIVL